MEKQTAVEWLAKEFCKNGIDIGSGYKAAYEIPKQLLEEAKAMEKEQILNACYQFSDYPFTKEDHLEYYNETYNK